MLLKCNKTWKTLKLKNMTEEFLKIQKLILKQKSYKPPLGTPLWCNGLGIWQCHYCGSGSIPSPGTSPSSECSKKKKTCQSESWCLTWKFWKQNCLDLGSYRPKITLTAKIGTPTVRYNITDALGGRPYIQLNICLCLLLLTSWEAMLWPNLTLN